MFLIFFVLPPWLTLGYHINPFTPKISLVILLTVSHTILILVQRIWY